MTPGALIIAVAGGYLLGSLPVAVWVGHGHGVDPRTVGDRNPGYWNTKATLGARAALPVLVGDTLKGTVAGLVGLAAAGRAGGHRVLVQGAGGGGAALVYAAVAAAMVGHAWPVFARFRGGRSILTFAGGMAVISPLTFVVCVVACVVVSVLWSFTIGARVGVFAVPAVQVVFDGWRWAAATFLMMSLVGLRFAQARRESSSAVGPVPPGADGA